MDAGPLVSGQMFHHDNGAGLVALEHRQEHLLGKGEEHSGGSGRLDVHGSRKAEE